MECLSSRAQRKFAFYPAIISENCILSYTHLNALVTATVEKLKAFHITPRTHVAIYSPNTVEYIILLLALWRQRAITCLLNIYLPPRSIQRQMQSVRCPIVFCNLENKQKIARKGFKILVIEDFIPFVVGKTIKSTTAFSVSLNQTITIMFTSGSSGEPKAAVHTLANHYYSALGSNQNIPIKTLDRWLLSLPLYHVSGLSILFRCILGGGAVVIPKVKAKIDTMIESFRVTHTSLIAIQLQRLLKTKNVKKSLKSLKAILLGGGPIPRPLITECLKKYLPLYTTYGLTEMSSQVATSQKLKTNDQRPKAKILRYRKLKISKAGEVLVKGQTLFKGYLKGKRIIRPSDNDGWFHTGDLGKLERGKYLTVFGRKDNLFISGGENIQPEEIERYLLAIKGIEKAVVVPCKDEKFDWRPVAFIKRRYKQTPHSKKIINLLEKHLPRFKIPIKFYRWPSHIQSKHKINRKLFEKLL